MKAVFGVLFFLALPSLGTSFQNSVEQCYESLLGLNQTKSSLPVAPQIGDSRAFYITDVEDALENPKNFAISAVSEVLASLNCPFDVMDGNIECKSFAHSHTTVCELSSYAGFFMVLNNYVDGAHVIFNRYD